MTEQIQHLYNLLATFCEKVDTVVPGNKQSMIEVTDRMVNVGVLTSAEAEVLVARVR